MNLEDYRVLFMVVILGVAFVAVSPVVGLVVPQGGSERFSEFWLLDAWNGTEDYPFVVGVGEVYSVFVGVSNHMGGSEYYRVCVKFGNSTQSLPDIDGSVPSSLPCLYENRFFVGDGEVWQLPVTFAFQDLTVQDNVLSVGDVTINGVLFPVNMSVSWDSERDGFFFQLFFELWRYDVELNSFRFHDRFVGIWLNMTAS